MWRVHRRMLSEGVIRRDTTECMVIERAAGVGRGRCVVRERAHHAPSTTRYLCVHAVAGTRSVGVECRSMPPCGNVGYICGTDVSLGRAHILLYAVYSQRGVFASDLLDAVLCMVLW